MEWEVGYVGLQLSCLSIKSRHEAEREKIKKKNLHDSRKADEEK